jgi:polysaccharide pyruvyl transferase WcaK-like protein
MKIVVENSGYDMRNLGDLAMLQVGVRRLLSLWPDAQIYVLTLNPDAVLRQTQGAKPFPLGNSSYASSDESVTGAAPKSGSRSVKKLLNSLKGRIVYRHPSLALRLMTIRRNRYGLEKIIREADLVLATGGGYITEIFPINMMGALSTLDIARRCGKPSVLMGHGIGPIDNPALLRLTGRVLRAARLMSLREKLFSLPLVEQMGVMKDRIHVTGDDAVEYGYLNRQDGPGEGLGINLRVASYSEVNPVYLQRVRTVLEAVVKEVKAPLIPLPISFYGRGDDLEAIDQLTQGLGCQVDGSRSFETVLDVVQAASGCRVVVTGSYHAGVFALSQGVPVVCLAKSKYYVMKFEGLADMFGRGCVVLHLDDLLAEEKLRQSILQLWQDADCYRESLLSAALDQMERSRETYRRIPEIVSTSREAV